MSTVVDIQYLSTDKASKEPLESAPESSGCIQLTFVPEINQKYFIKIPQKTAIAQVIKSVGE